MCSTAQSTPASTWADSGVTPPELSRSISAAGLTVTTNALKAQRPARLTEFRISLNVLGVDDQRHRDGILRGAKSCLIHNTLTYAATIQIELENKNAEVDQYQSELVAKH
jgi:hypothetical protein